MQLIMKTTTGIKLDEDTRTRLQSLGTLKERSPHWLMKRAIKEYLAREERYEREKQEDFLRWLRYEESGVFIDRDEMRDRMEALAADARNRTSTAE